MQKTQGASAPEAEPISVRYMAAQQAAPSPGHLLRKSYNTIGKEVEVTLIWRGRLPEQETTRSQLAGHTKSPLHEHTKFVARIY
jgi:hypothetical protein